MRRICVIGSGGAGKSTLARRIGEILGIEVIHLDVHFWNAGWIETETCAWRQKLSELVERPVWVMDGNFGDTLDMRLARADTVVFLDRSRFLCLWRAIKRVLKYKGKTRPDLAEGCPEKWDLEFLKWVWNYPRKIRAEMIEKVRRFESEGQIFHLKRERDVRKFLATLQENAMGD